MRGAGGATYQAWNPISMARRSDLAVGSPDVRAAMKRPTTSGGTVSRILSIDQTFFPRRSRMSDDASSDASLPALTKMDGAEPQQDMVTV